jgi:hypothetical protein
MTVTVLRPESVAHFIDRKEFHRNTQIYILQPTLSAEPEVQPLWSFLFSRRDILLICKPLLRCHAVPDPLLLRILIQQMVS